MKRIHWIILSALLLSGAGYLILIGPVGQRGLRRLVQTRLQQRLATRVEIGRLAGSLSGPLELHDLSVYLPSSPDPFLRVGRLTLHFSWSGLLGRGFPFPRLDVEKVRLQFQDRQQVKDGLAWIRRLENRESSGGPIPGRWLPAVSHLKEIRFAFADSGDTLQIHSSSLRLVREEHRSSADRLQLTGGPFLVERNQRPAGPFSLRGFFLVNRHSVRLEDFSVSAPDLEFRLRGESTGGASRFTIWLDGEGDLQSIVPLVFPGNELTGKGNLQVELKGVGKTLRAAGRVRLQHLRTAHFTLDTLEARFTHADGRLALDSLRIAIGSGRLIGRSEVDLRPANQPWDLNLAVREVDLGRIFPSLPVDGTMHGRLKARGRWPDAPFLAADLELQGANLAFEGRPLGPSALEVRYDSSRVDIDLQSRLGTWELQGRLTPQGNHALTGHLSVPALEEWGSLFGLPGLQGRLRARVESRGDLQAPSLQAAISGEQIAHDPLWLGDLEAGLQIDSSGTFRLELEAPGQRLRLDAAGDLGSGVIANGRLDLGEISIAACLHPEYRPLWSGHLGASLVFSGALQDPHLQGEIRLRELAYGRQSFGDTRSLLSLVDRQIRLQLQTPDSSVALSSTMKLENGLPFSLQAKVHSADLAPFLYLIGRRESGYAGTISGQLQADGQLRRPEQVRANMKIDALRLTAGERTLELTRPARVRVEDGVATIRDLRISGSEGSLRIDGRAARLGALDMRVDLEDLQLSFLSPFLGTGRRLHGSIDAHFHLSGQSRTPMMEGRLHGKGLRYGTRVLGDLQTVFSYRTPFLQLDQLVLNPRRGRLHGWAIWPLHLDLVELRGTPTDGNYELRLSAAGIEVGGELGLPPGVELHADGSLHLRGPARDPGQITGSIHLPRLQLRAPQALLDNVNPIDLRLEPGKWILAPSVFRVSSSGETSVEMGAVQAAGTLVRQGDSSLRIQVRDLDLSPLSRQIPEIEQLEGRLDLDLDIGGSWEAPEPRGALSIRAGEIRLPGVKTRLAFSAGQIAIQPGQARLSGFEGWHGKGRWNLSGDIHLNAIRPDSLDLELALTDMDLRFSENTSLMVDGNLRWTGTPAASHLRGRLRIPGGRIVRILDVTSPAGRESAPLPPSSPFLGRIVLQAEIDVQQVDLDATFAKARLRGNLDLRGTAARPIVSGRIVGTDAYLLYLDRRFAMERATLLLVNPEPVQSLFTLFQHPAQLDPQVDIAARSLLVATDGNEYRIDLGLSGPLSDLQFEMASDPPQNRAQILSLLNFGAPDVPMLDSSGMLLDRAATLSTRYLLQVPRTHFQRVLDLERVEIDANLFKPARLGSSRLTLSKKLNPRTEVTYSTTVGHAAEGRVKINYDLARYLFLEVERDALGESGADLKLRLKFR